MRVCLVTTEYPPFTSDVGGIGTQYAALAPALVAAGVELHVVAPAAEEPGDVERDGVRVHLLAPGALNRFGFVRRLAWARRADRAIRSLGPFDVVFAPEWGGGASLYGRRQSAGPLITNLQSSLEQVLRATPSALGLRGRASTAIQRRLERTLAERSDAIVTPTQAVRDWAGQVWKLDGKPTTIIPNVIDIERIRRLARSPLPEGYPTAGPVVVYWGRLEPLKGVDILVAAMGAVWRSLPQAQLVMLGEDLDGMSASLRQMAGERGANLHILGYQPIEQLFSAIAAADVAALPSMWENFSIAALEAMTLGRATVLTSGTGSAEFFEAGRDGLMVAPGDVSALGEALLSLLSDPDLRRRYGEAAAASVAQFSVGEVVPRYVEYFQRVGRA